MGSRGNYKSSGENSDYLFRRSRKVRRRITNGKCFVVGKYKGKKLEEVEAEDPQYYSWAKKKRIL